ncbi:hypothetical protein ABBQ32_001797 [Trebouxia sp. C0010 RCD-2024]
MEVDRHNVSENAEDARNNLWSELSVHIVSKTHCSQSLPTCSCQTRLDYTVQQKQRMAAKMKQEQKEMQAFSSLMKSVLHDNKDRIKDHQDKIAQEHKQTEQKQCELALLQESIAQMQQQRDSLQSLLAQQEQCLTQRQRKVSDMATQLVQLRQSQQQERQQAQEQLDSSRKLLNHLLEEQEHRELRLRQEQAAVQNTIIKHQDLQSQMQKVKQAVLALSE